MSIVRIFIYHAASSNKMLREIHRALAIRLQRTMMFVNKPENADLVFGVYLSDNGRIRVLRKLGGANASHCSSSQH